MVLFSFYTYSRDSGCRRNYFSRMEGIKRMTMAAEKDDETLSS